MKQIKVTDQDSAVNFTFYDNANGVILRNFEGFEYPSVRDVIEDISGKGGATYVTSKFGRRLVSWSGDLVSSSIFTLRRQMLAALRQQGRMKLIEFTTYDNLALRFEAEITKVLNPYTHSIHSFLIEAVAADWRFFSQAEEEVEIASGASDDAVNDGNEETDPVFRIDGPGTSFSVTNNDTGESFVVEREIAEGEYIEINVSERTILLNGTTPIYSNFEGDFITLEPGENEIEFVAVAGGGTTLLTITFRHAYNGL
jgi:hypothetical protein